MSFVIRVYTPAYVITGQSESNNAFLGWLNNPNKQTLDLTDVQGLSLDPAAVLSSFAQALITLPKRQIVAIDLVSQEAQAAVQKSPRADLAVLYTGLEIERVGVGQQRRQTLGDGLAVFFRDSDVDFHVVLQLAVLRPQPDEPSIARANSKLLELFQKIAERLVNAM